MKPETENAIRSMVMMDPEVTKDMLERAIAALRGKAESDDDIVHNVRFGDAMELLKVSGHCATTSTVATSTASTAEGAAP